MECSFLKHIPGLQKDELHLWFFSALFDPGQVKEFKKVLSNDEIERANSFRFDEHRNRFIIFRACLRFVLARYLEVKPTQIRFFYGSYGKPTIVEELNQLRLSFNQSHTNGLSLLAITQELSVGVDVEFIRDDFPFESVAQHYFSANEIAELKKLSSPAAKEVFFNYWTRKESFLKATGCGLSIPLDSFDVSPAANSGLVTLTTHPAPQESIEWSIQDLQIDRGYSAALAIQGPMKNIHCFHYQDYFRFV